MTTPDMQATVAKLAELGVTATAWNAEEYGSALGFEVDAKHFADWDCDGMLVEWSAEHGWTFTQWCHPGQPASHFLDPVSPAGACEVAAQVKAIVDGTVDEFRPVPECPCVGPYPDAMCSLHGVAATLRFTFGAESSTTH